MKRNMPPLIPFLCGLMMINGCANGRDEPAGRRAAPAPPRFTAAEPVELAEWWTNGWSLLRLRAEGSYELYAELNRYDAPAERGQWSERSYVALEFEPYSVRHRRVERVQLDRDSEGGLVLILRDELPFVPIDRPPEVLEDSLFGSWQGEEYLLTLDRDMRYRYRVLRPGASGTGGGTGSAAVSGHEGTWSVRGISEVVLRPDAPGLPALVLNVAGGDRVALEGAERVPGRR